MSMCASARGCACIDARGVRILMMKCACVVA